MEEKQEKLVLECVKTDYDIIIRFICWFFAVLISVGAFFQQNVLLVYCLAVPLALVAILHRLFKKSYRVTATDEYIEKCCLYLYRRKKMWSQVSAYKLKHKEGYHHIGTSHSWENDDSGYIEEEYTILLYFDKGLPMRISNSLTNYKRFKKLLKKRDIKRLKTKKKSPFLL